MYDDILAHEEIVLQARFESKDFTSILGMCAWAATWETAEVQKHFYDKARSILMLPFIKALPLSKSGQALRSCLFSNNQETTQTLRHYSHRLKRSPWWRILANRAPLYIKKTKPLQLTN